jgi:transposase
MRVQTLLHHVEKQPRFVYGAPWLRRAGSRQGLHVPLRAKKNCRPLCGNCGRPGPAYDRLKVRHYRYLPLFATLAVFFVYRPRRCDCRRCGVTVEMVPWATGKSPITHAFGWFLASWAQRLSWQEVARHFRVSWGVVFEAVERAVEWGLAHRNLDDIVAIGVDELARRKGQVYFTMVYQIDHGCRRLLWLGKDRTKKTFNLFFDELGSRCTSLRFATSDMWKAYLSVLKKRVPRVVHVLDRFHVSQLVGKAIDQVRREEVKRLRREGKAPLLTGSRWWWLKNPKNLTEKQGLQLGALLKTNLRTARAYVLADILRGFWDLSSRRKGMAFLANWIYSAKRSRLVPFQKVAATLTAHQALLMNWFRARNAFAKGATEGLNNKARVVTRRAYGFRTAEVARIALFHALGKLPEPEWVTHRFG